MNKLNEMDIAALDKKEIDKLEQYEKEFNQVHEGEEVYLLALKR